MPHVCCCTLFVDVMASERLKFASSVWGPCKSGSAVLIWKSMSRNPSKHGFQLLSLQPHLCCLRGDADDNQGHDNGGGGGGGGGGRNGDDDTEPRAERS